MDLLIHYQPALPRDNVFIHAWEKDGKVWDFLGEKNPDGSFLFQVKGVNLPDLRDFSFKYRFLGNQWESDDFTRQLPTTTSQEVWTFDYTARCLTQPPSAAIDFSQITFHVLTQSKYVGGSLYLWQPHTDQTISIPQHHRDDASHISTFIVPFQDWMRQGFHFKLKSASNAFEADSVNRIWQPSDGAEVWLKAGQLDLRTQPIEQVTETLELRYPATLATTPSLNLQDRSDDYQASFPPTEPPTLDPDPLFRTARYSFQVYRGATYTIDFNPPGSTGRSFPPLPPAARRCSRHHSSPLWTSILAHCPSPPQCSNQTDHSPQSPEPLWLPNSLAGWCWSGSRPSGSDRSTTARWHLASRSPGFPRSAPMDRTVASQRTNRTVAGNAPRNPSA